MKHPTDFIDPIDPTDLGALKQSALEQSVQYLRRAAYRYARLHGLGEEDAQECAQECVVRVLNTQRAVLVGEVPVRHLGAWLRGCARHGVIDYVRRAETQRRWQAPLRGPRGPNGGSLPWEIPDNTGDPDSCLQRQEYLRRLCRAIDQLNDTPHFYVIEHYFLNVSVGEIAHSYGTTAAQVYKTLRRALDELGRLLLAEGLGRSDLLGAFDVPPRQLPPALTDEADDEKS